MRCFLGLPVAAPMRQQLKRWCATAPAADICWEAAEDWHLTVAFLGQAEDTTITALLPAVASACAQAAVIHQPLAAPARFPTEEGPILALEGKPEPALVALRNALAPLCKALGLPWEARTTFRPHVTLARRYPLESAVPPLPGPLLLAADELLLYRSEPPDAAGQRYRIHARWPLGRA